MNPSHRKTVEEIFDQVLERPRGSWDRVLADLCAGNEDLEGEVNALLRAHERADGILDRPAGAGKQGQGGTGARKTQERVGRYRILRELGKGGMGTVYLAERADGQFRQRVALKLIPSTDDELTSRIVAERQILASLQHPSIARLLDGGLTEDGRPYLVMEFVGGLPVDVYCDRMRLTIRERLQVFLTILEAVEHAHHNLVVHRDLKPSNILASPSGEVKLLDFGIAKLLNPNLGGIDSPVTQRRDRALTPEYASPEQVRGEAITTAADVYSLGIVLYEILAGYRPYSFQEGALQDLVRVVCDVDPPPPSLRISGRAGNGRGDGVPTEEEKRAVADSRHTTTARHVRSLKGDLDAIVMKAIRKEPSRRYTSVEPFAQDIRRYLDDRPVMARKGSGWYWIRKLATRHRAAALATVVVVVSVLGGAGTAAWQAGVAARERDRTQTALRESEEVSEFLLGLFEASDPLETPGDTVTALDLLRRGEQRAASLTDEPVVQARLLQVISQAQKNLGRYSDAEELAGRAVDLLESRFDEGTPDLARAYLGLGTALKNNGRYDSARVVLERALSGPGIDEGGGPLAGAEIQEELARVLIYLGDLSGAEDRVIAALEVEQNVLGPGSPSALNTRGTLASIYRFQGRYDLAEEEFRGVLARRRSLDPPDTDGLTRDLLQLGDLLSIQGEDLDQARVLYEEAVALLHDGSARASPNLVWGLTSLGKLLEEQGDLEESETLFTQAVEVRRRTFGESHPLVAETLGEYASFLIRHKRPRKAEALLREASEIDLKTVGPSHSRHAGTLEGLAMALASQGRLEEADSLNQVALQIRTAAQGGRTITVALSLAAGADIRIRMGRFQEAEGMLNEALSIVSGKPIQGLVPGRIHAVYVRLYEAWNKPTLAEAHRRLASPGT